MFRLSMTGAVACLVMTAFVGGCGGGSGSETESPRHVVLISLDTTRADHFGFLGNKTVRTPRLDALAAESIVLTNYMTVVPTTLASHTSLFTGNYPHRHGVPRNGFMVHPDNEMLPETLKRAGFNTAGFLGSFALERRFGFDQGFDFYDEEFNILVGDGGTDQNQRVAADVTDAVISYLDEAGVPDRLFLFVHYFDAHAPYAAPTPYATMYDPLGRVNLPPLEVLAEEGRVSPEVRDRITMRYAQQYAAEISYMDDHVGRLLDDLRKRGILDDALLIVTSDHGENLLDHRSYFNHGYTLFQSTMRGVCIIRKPGQEMAGTRLDDLVASIDIAPTILALLGLDAPEGIDGESIDLSGQDSEQRTRFGQATKPWRCVETDPRWANILKSRCIRRGNYKFIQTPYANSEELYDIDADPGETQNLLEGDAAKVGQVVDDLRIRLEAWAQSANPLPTHFERDQHAETIRRLKSLGYL